MTVAINIPTQALYILFAANSALPPYHSSTIIPTLILLVDQNLEVLQRGCFHYFQIGIVDGPIGLQV